MTPTAKTKSKQDEIFDTINHFFVTGNYTPFDVKKLKKDAEKIKDNKDLAAGFELLGMIASLENDVDRVHSYHKRAVEQSGGDADRLANYSKSLTSLGRFHEAYRFASEGYQKDPSSLSVLDALVHATCALNKRDEFNKYTSEWSKILFQEHDLTGKPLYIAGSVLSCKRIWNDHPEIREIQFESSEELIQIFGAPLNVLMEILPDPGNVEVLVGWIQWYGEVQEGLEKFDRFRDWYIDNNLDLQSDRFHFNIELLEQNNGL